MKEVRDYIKGKILDFKIYDLEQLQGLTTYIIWILEWVSRHEFF